MTMWTESDLEALGGLNELPISAPRADGSFTRTTPIWVLRVGDQIVVRSWHGATGSWYRNAIRSGYARIDAPGGRIDVTVEEIGSDQRDAIDAEYRRKYSSRGDWYVQQMLQPVAVAATLRLLPR